MHKSTGNHRRQCTARAAALALTAALALVVSACDAAQPGTSDRPTASEPTETSTPGETQSAPVDSPSPAESPAARPGSASTDAHPDGSYPGHVFVINLENKGYFQTWGQDSPAPYLSRTLRSRGVLLSEYYGIAHNSNPNYLAQISGQTSNAMTRDDCPTYAPVKMTGTGPLGQVEATGCVYPASVPTVAGQISAAGKTWKGYMEDMATPCQHPEPGAEDDHHRATPTDQYPPGTTRSSTSNPSLRPRTAPRT